MSGPPSTEGTSSVPLDRPPGRSLACAGAADASAFFRAFAGSASKNDGMNPNRCLAGLGRRRGARLLLAVAFPESGRVWNMVPRPILNVMDRSPHGGRLLLTTYNSVESTICFRAHAIGIFGGCNRRRVSDGKKNAERIARRGTSGKTRRNSTAINMTG